jgi:hypothetical protein
MPRSTNAIIGAGVSGTSLSLRLQASSLVTRATARHGTGRRQVAGGDGHWQWSKSSRDWASCQQDGSPEIDPWENRTGINLEFGAN